MTTSIKRRRGTTAQTSVFTGAVGETTVDTTKQTVVVHDGATAGGFPLATEANVALKANTASPSFTGTVGLPAVTLAGTVAGGGNQLNNVVIGATTPLAGSFTTLGATGNIVAGANGSSQGFIKLWSAGGTSREANLYSPAGGGLTIDTNSASFPIVTNSSAFTIQTASVERMRIDSSGNVGIGTSSPVSRIHASYAGALNTNTFNVSTTSVTVAPKTLIGANLVLSDDATTYTKPATSISGAGILFEGINSSGTHGSIQFLSAPDDNTGSATPTERMRIDSAGNVLVGTTTARGKLHSYAANYTPATSAWATAASFTAGGAFGGGVSFVDGAAGWGMWVQDSGGNFSIGQGATSGGLSEKIRITSAGNLLVGTTSYSFSSTNYGIGFKPNGETFWVADTPSNLIAFNRNSDGTVFKFFRSGTQVGAVSVTTTATAYNTSSDYRLKNTIAPMTGALAKVALLKPCTYKWIVDGSDGQGFIAHELDEVVPGCVTGEKDAVDAEGKPQYQGIDTSFLVATLTAAIQEQQAIIEDMKARLTAAGI